MTHHSTFNGAPSGFSSEVHMAFLILLRYVSSFKILCIVTFWNFVRNLFLVFAIFFQLPSNEAIILVRISQYSFCCELWKGSACYSSWMLLTRPRLDTLLSYLSRYSVLFVPCLELFWIAILIFLITYNTSKFLTLSYVVVMNIV